MNEEMMDRNGWSFGYLGDGGIVRLSCTWLATELYGGVLVSCWSITTVIAINAGSLSFT